MKCFELDRKGTSLICRQYWDLSEEDHEVCVRFDAFPASGYDEVFSGYQPGKVVQFCRNQRFEDHLCPRPQGC